MASTLRILRLFLRESHASRSNNRCPRWTPARLISKVDAFGNEKMTTRSQFYQLALEANERQANVRDDVLPIPTLDERVTLYLRAVHGNRDFTEEERSNARNLLLNSMASEIAAQVIPAEQSLRGKLPARETNAASNITYEYKGFKVIYGNSQSGRIASIYQDGQLRSWASDLQAGVQWIDESTHAADGGSSLVSRSEKPAQ